MSQTLLEKDICSNVTYIVRCHIPCHIPCQKRIFTEMSHILSGVIYPVTYLVRIGYLMKCHILCQVSYSLSHTLSEKDIHLNVTYIVRWHMHCSERLFNIMFLFANYIFDHYILSYWKIISNTIWINTLNLKEFPCSDRLCLRIWLLCWRNWGSHKDWRTKY